MELVSNIYAQWNFEHLKWFPRPLCLATWALFYSRSTLFVANNAPKSSSRKQHKNIRLPNHPGPSKANMSKYLIILLEPLIMLFATARIGAGRTPKPSRFANDVCSNAKKDWNRTFCLFGFFFWQISTATINNVNGSSILIMHFTPNQCG